MREHAFETGIWLASIARPLKMKGCISLMPDVHSCSP